MKVKIEKAVTVPAHGRHMNQDFLVGLRSLQAGESFAWEMTSYDRAAGSIAQTLLERRFMTRAEPNGFRRVWRVK